MTETEKWESGRPALLWRSLSKALLLAAERGARRLWFDPDKQWAVWDDGMRDQNGHSRGGVIYRMEIEATLLGDFQW